MSYDRRDFLDQFTSAYDETKFKYTGQKQLARCSYWRGKFQKYTFPSLDYPDIKHFFIKNLRIGTFDSLKIKKISFCQGNTILSETCCLEELQQIYGVDKLTVPFLNHYIPLLSNMNIYVETDDCNSIEICCDYYYYCGESIHLDWLFSYSTQFAEYTYFKYDDITEKCCPVIRFTKFYFHDDYDDVYLIGGYICPPEKSTRISHNILKINTDSISSSADSKQTCLKISCTKPEMVLVICIRKNLSFFDSKSINVFTL
jgi:hypothetical protein